QRARMRARRGRPLCRPGAGDTSDILSVGYSTMDLPQPNKKPVEKTGSKTQRTIFKNNPGSPLMHAC
ncbi:MAG TPA: hypothetical protein PLZ78_14210, partial [Spirochaetota bacterium]|nr:hypothetical protein [Spirochaetota bacterium]